MVWFIDPTIAREDEVKSLASFLKENGVVVITDSESHSVLLTLDGAYRRYGLSLIDSLPDWYGLVLDEEARAAFRQAVENGEIYNFISSWPRPKWERLGLALQGFAEETNVAVGLRDFVRRNRDSVVGRPRAVGGEHPALLRVRARRRNF